MSQKQAKNSDPPARKAGEDGEAPVAPQNAEPEASPAAPTEIDALRAELDELKDRELRARAELDNYRKRAARQSDEERRYANLPLLRDLLPVLDNLRRAVEAAEKSPEGAGLLDGVRMVIGQFHDVLERHHCTPIAALYAPFDPNFHEAILQQPSAEYPANTVMHEVQGGFQLHDRVVRPVQVIVSSGSPQASNTANPQAGIATGAAPDGAMQDH